MPYSKPSDAPDYIPEGKKAQWVEVWNSVYKQAIKDGKSEKEAESWAFQNATGVAKKDGKDSLEGSITMKHEVRFLKAELRAESQGEEMALVGYAAMFNCESKDLGGFRETILPGAFKRSIDKGDDVKALFNHNPNAVLGRTKNKTLTLKEDERGLQFRCQLDPNQQAHRDLHAAIKRGDIDECSFAFTVPDGGQEWTTKRGTDDWMAARTLKDVNLMDVSAVTYPAYEGTAVMARGEEIIPAEIRSAIEAHKLDAEAEAQRAAAAAAEQRSDDEPDGDESDGDWDADGDEMPGDSDAVKEAKRAYKAVKGAAKDAYKKAKDEAGAMKDEGKDKAKAHKAAAKDTYKKAKDGAKAALKAVKDGEAQRSMDAIIEQHKKAAAEAALVAAAHKTTADEHTAAAEAVQAAEDARKAACAERKKKFEDEGYDPEDYEGEDQYEENCMVQRDKVWSGDKPKDDATEEEKNCYGSMREAFLGTLEFRDNMVRTKKVGGKNLTKDKFAFVGDANDTATWKYPIHDASHVRNALARWGQHTGIPAESEAGVYGKIKSAAKKFGVEVTETNADKAARAAQELAEYRDDRLRRLKAGLLG